MAEEFPIVGISECSLAEAQKAEQLSRQRLGDLAFGDFSFMQSRLGAAQSNDLKGIMPDLFLVSEEKAVPVASGFARESGAGVFQERGQMPLAGLVENGAQVGNSSFGGSLERPLTQAHAQLGKSHPGVEKSQSSAGAGKVEGDVLPELTVEQVLSLTPEVLPEHLMLKLSPGVEFNDELARLKSGYQERYGETLGWGGEIKGDKVDLNLLVSHDQADLAAKERLTSSPATIIASTASSSSLGGDFGSAHSGFESSPQTEQEQCISDKTRELENRRLGLTADADDIDRQQAKDALLAKLDPNMDAEKFLSILKARREGVDESLPVEEINRLTDVADRARWAQVLGLPPGSSSETIERVKDQALAKFSQGLEGEAKLSAESVLLDQWQARYAGLPNPESQSSEVINSAYEEVMRQNRAQGMKLDADSTWDEISARQERLQMRLSPDTSNQEVERIKQARLLNLGDDTSTKELNRYEQQFQKEKAELLKGCQAGDSLPKRK